MGNGFCYELFATNLLDIKKIPRSDFQKKQEVEVQLTEIEEQILGELAAGLSYKAISNKIYLSVDGVRYHIRNIYQKLEAKNRSEAVAKGINFNLIQP